MMELVTSEPKVEENNEVIRTLKGARTQGNNIKIII